MKKENYTRQEVDDLLVNIYLEIMDLKRPPEHQNRDYYMEGVYTCADIVADKRNII